MFDVMRKNYLQTAVVMVSVTVIAAVYLLLVARFTMQQNDGNVGALLDDTWIHVRFADHISDGKGLSYNEGELTTGATSPLWVLLLAVPYAIFNPSIMTQVDIAIVMSAIMHIISVLTITGFGWWATKQAWIGFAAGLITTLTGRYIWVGLSGMEITTFTTLCILSIWSHMHDIRERRPFGWRTGILLALSSLARPEAYLLAFLIGIDSFLIVPLRDQRGDSSIASMLINRAKAGWRGIIGYTLLAGTYPFVSLMISGYPLPNTFRAKSQLGREYPDLPRAFFWTPNVDHGPILIVLASIGTLYLLWQSRRKNGMSAIWALWPPLFVLAVLFMGSQRFNVNHGRYVVPAIPFHALAAVVGIWVIGQLLVQINSPSNSTLNWGKRYLLPVGLIGTIAVVAFVRGEYNGAQVANDVMQLRKMHVRAGYWVLDHTDPDESIALNDVGAIIHISNRRVIDLEGLVTPEVIDATRDMPDHTCPHDLQLARIMLKDPPKFIGVFPWFYPCLTSWPNALQPFDQFEITGPTVIAGGQLVMYWPLWENWPMQAAIPNDVFPINAHFEEGIELAGYQTALVEEGLEVVLWWRSHGQPSSDHHIFVHLIDSNNNLVQVDDGQGNLIDLQHDSEPQQTLSGNRFSMSWWREGDIIRDRHVIHWDDLSVFQEQGIYINIGVYRFPSGQRLQVVEGGSGTSDFVNLPLMIQTKIFG